MSPLSSVAARGLLAVSLALTAALGACSTAPKPVAAPPPPPPEAPKPDFTPKQMAPIPNPTSEPPAHAASSPSVAKRPPPAKAPPAKPPEAVAANPIRASQLRAAGLVELNRGAIARAVVLLREANQADPDNRLIQRDLERALRISRAVSAKP